MSNYPLQVSVKDYPELSNLIPGQEVELKVEARVGTRVLGGQDDVLSFIIKEISVVEEEREGRMSPSEYLLSRIASYTGQLNTPVP
jgi:hypothetical protein